MNTANKTAAFRLLVLITDIKLSEKAIDIFAKSNTPVQLEVCAQGTASSEIMDILGLGGIEKTVLTAFLPKEQADKTLSILSDKLKLTQKNSGIAFTLPLSGMNSFLVNMCANMTDEKRGKGNITVSEMKYALIAATVNQGFGEEVMNAARPAGAKGGTIMHNRSIASGEMMSFIEGDFSEERETVLIITEKERKLEIMQAIHSACGMNTDAQGIIFSMPIDNIMGLNS